MTMLLDGKEYEIVDCPPEAMEICKNHCGYSDCNQDPFACIAGANKMLKYVGHAVSLLTRMKNNKTVTMCLEADERAMLETAGIDGALCRGFNGKWLKRPSDAGLKSAYTYRIAEDWQPKPEAESVDHQILGDNRIDDIILVNNVWYDIVEMPDGDGGVQAREAPDCLSDFSERQLKLARENDIVTDELIPWMKALLDIACAANLLAFKNHASMWVDRLDDRKRKAVVEDTAYRLTSTVPNYVEYPVIPEPEAMHSTYIYEPDNRSIMLTVGQRNTDYIGTLYQRIDENNNEWDEWVMKSGRRVGDVQELGLKELTDYPFVPIKIRMRKEVK